MLSSNPAPSGSLPSNASDASHGEPFFPSLHSLYAYILLMDGQPTTVYQTEEDAMWDKWLEEQASTHGTDPAHAPPVFTIVRLPLHTSIPF